MSLKREILVDAGITDNSVLDNIMQAYGAGIENAKAQAKSELQAENDTLKQQLEQQTQAIKDLQVKEGASAESKQQLADLQAQFDQYKTDSETKLAQVTKTNAVALALKDVDAHNSDDLAKFINMVLLTKVANVGELTLTQEQLLTQQLGVSIVKRGKHRLMRWESIHSIIQ